VGGFRQEQWEGEQKIHEIKLAYAPRIDANSGLPLPEGTANSVENRKYCEFSRWVYNPKLDPRFGLQTALEPAHLGQRRLWQEVNRDNPDPEHLEPGLEVGATALKRRFDDQKNQIASFANYTEEVLSTLAVIDKSSRHVSAKMEELQGKQARLYHKSLVVMRKLELCRLIGTSITPDEQRYRERLDRLVRALQHPNEVIQRLMIVQSQLDRTGGDVYGKDPSPREEEMLVKALEKQRQGLQHLTDILK
ncbi:Nup54, partial [Symbiodinium microadriaticum]